MKATLDIAVLCYGASRISVDPTETSPLPTEYDFSEDPVEFARKVLAVMSNASGGHTLRDCKVRVVPGRSINITSSGTHNYYAVPGLPKLPVEVAIALASSPFTELGSVTTDQYGEGYNRARWTQEV